MAGPCSADFERLAQQLGGFGCEGQHPVLNLHAPTSLENWTLLVIEVAVVACAVLALRHAWHRRRAGDPTGIAIYLAALAYLVVVEPPLYFPDRFGLDEQVGLIFVHNEFTVQFLWGRLPLYIVAIYPALAYLAYEVVRLIGVTRRSRPWVTAVTVGFVYHCFYEVFDQVGPQLRWWIWNPDAPTNEPFLASVPISSMVNFAVAGPAALTFLVLVLVSRRPDAADMRRGTLVWRSLLAGALMPVGLVLGGMPATVFTFGDEVNRTGQAVAYWFVLGIAAVVAVRAIVDTRRGRSGVDDPVAERYVHTSAAVFLGALVVSWAAAMPDYLGATNGLTADGTPRGSLAYAVVSGVLALVAWRLATTPTTGSEADEGMVRDESAVAVSH